MTGKNLIMALEYSITVNNNQNGWFYYFSGLKMEYSPTSTQGQRVKKITDNSGKAIDSDKVYNVAIMAHSVNDEYIIESESTNILISTMLEQEIKTSKQISPSKDGRFIVVNP